MVVIQKICSDRKRLSAVLDELERRKSLSLSFTVSLSPHLLFLIEDSVLTRRPVSDSFSHYISFLLSSFLPIKILACFSFSFIAFSQRNKIKPNPCSPPWIWLKKLADTKTTYTLLKRNAARFKSSSGSYPFASSSFHKVIFNQINPCFEVTVFLQFCLILTSSSF